MNNGAMGSRFAIRLMVAAGLGAGLVAVVGGISGMRAHSSAEVRAAGVELPTNPTADGASDQMVGQTTLHRSREELMRHEAQYSAELQDYRRQYRMARLVRDPVQRRQRMLQIAEDVASALARHEQANEEVWLRLLEDTCFAGGDLDGLRTTLEERCARRVKLVGQEALANELLDEAGLRASRREIDFAAALLDQAETLATADETFIAAVRQRGALYSQNGGSDVAIDYYISLVGEYREARPVLAQAAHFAVAEEYLRSGQLDAALAVLDQIAEAYPQTEAAAMAASLRQAWAPQPGERIEPIPSRPQLAPHEVP